MAQLWQNELQAQEQPIDPDTAKAEKVIIKHSDLMRGIPREGIELTDFLEGNVELRQGPIHLCHCDTAVL